MEAPTAGSILLKALVTAGVLFLGAALLDARTIMRLFAEVLNAVFSRTGGVLEGERDEFALLGALALVAAAIVWIYI